MSAAFRGASTAHTPSTRYRWQRTQLRCQSDQARVACFGSPTTGQDREGSVVDADKREARNFKRRAWWAARSRFRDLLSCMKHPPLDSPSSLSPPRALPQMSSRAVCTRLSRRAQLSGVLPVLSRSSRICPLDRLAVCVVGLGLALVLVRWWWWSLV